MRIDLSTARELLDLGKRMGSKQRGDEQLEGAVALHEMLERHGVAYLADEVGMGKTYVALAVVALFRHFNPNFRVLFIAPRKNIQYKWIKELGNFTRYCVKVRDFRVKSVDGRSGRAAVPCDGLLELVHETTLDPDRDFFMRMSSFSLALGKDSSAWTNFRDRVKKEIPWIKDEAFSLRSKEAFKQNVGRAICCALPEFDLVIVDEAHNLKHGYSENGSARNYVLGLSLGHPSDEPPKDLFPRYGRRAQRVLFLSATPVEDTYRHLYNQLELFGLADGFERLEKNISDHEDEEQKALAKKILIRRVTSIRSGANERLTKNMYRREWRAGGVVKHDEPLEIKDDRQRLVVALVQKKVSELLQNERFGASFQIGMLASFESFAQTAKVKQGDADITFDDAEQTDKADERDGIDVNAINALAKSYRRRFGNEMPHPKMDALVERLARAWTTGEKALVFVRRVASVKELKRKLDDRYDLWLIDRLRKDLPGGVHVKFNNAVDQYYREKQEARERNADFHGPAKDDDDDRGGVDTFFAWFFRGEGPKEIVSGANVAQRFKQQSGPLATFFERNHVAMLLGARPGHVITSIAGVLGVDDAEVRAEIQNRAGHYLGRTKEQERRNRFLAAQAAALELLRDRSKRFHDDAQMILHECHENRPHRNPVKVPRDIADFLEEPTFFTELLEEPALCAQIWPASTAVDARDAFRERELRAEFLASAVRLGHAFIDFYVMLIGRLKSLEPRAQEKDEEDTRDRARIRAFLQVLKAQMTTPREARPFGAFDELAAIAEHFDLILDVNDAEARGRRLEETTGELKVLFGKQQPVGGMSGQVTPTLVRQFRMPGYPFVLVSTELLQEGEDLHTFCSAIYHYGISWTPSSMEQRIGRIDRVRSQTDRRISRMEGPLDGPEKLEVFYPHLQNTVEVLQVQRVLERMNTFLRLMHEGLSNSTSAQRTIDVPREMLAPVRPIIPVDRLLESAFPVPGHIRDSGGRKGLAVSADFAKRAITRFLRIAKMRFGAMVITWEDKAPEGVLLGTATLGTRIQPFGLYLQSHGDHLLVRCISPVGRVSPAEAKDEIAHGIASLPVRLGVIQDKNACYDLTVEDDVLLADETHDSVRVAMLIRRVVHQADQCEQRHLPGQDEVMAAFRSGLEKESSDGV